MRRAVLRLMVALAALPLAHTSLAAQSGAWCWWGGTYCCDHTGWCYSQCPEQGGQGEYILKAFAAGMCKANDGEV
jgi:hypothetical protein